MEVRSDIRRQCFSVGLLTERGPKLDRSIHSVYCAAFISTSIVLYLAFHDRELHTEIFEAIKIIMRFKEPLALKIHSNEVIRDENFPSKLL